MIILAALWCKTRSRKQEAGNQDMRMVSGNGTIKVESFSLEQSCHLTDGFGLFLQGLLAFTAFCILILKRLREPIGERRPVKIWFYDTSKQGFGAIIIHFANVFYAKGLDGDPCTWYFINFLLDTTIGLLIIWASLKFAQWTACILGCTQMRFGEYGNPPQFTQWLVQCIIYTFVMIVEKSIIILLVRLKFWEKVRRFILRPIQSPKLEGVIVMFIVPFVMNALMFWVVDNFLMRKRRKGVHVTGEKVGVKFLTRPKNRHSSDDEVVLHSLIQHESHDTLLEEIESAAYLKDHVK